MKEFFEFVEEERYQYLKDIEDTKTQIKEQETPFQYDGSYLFFQEIKEGVPKIKDKNEITQRFQQRFVLDSVTTTNPEILQFKNKYVLLRKLNNEKMNPKLKELTKI